MIEAIALTVITGTLAYVVHRLDELDCNIEKRLDRLGDRLTRLEILLPKRKADSQDTYYSPNSGIDL